MTLTARKNHYTLARGKIFVPLAYKNRP